MSRQLVLELKSEENYVYLCKSRGKESSFLCCVFWLVVVYVSSPVVWVLIDCFGAFLPDCVVDL
jgi:uncharacterized membrane-anchored protein